MKVSVLKGSHNVQANNTIWTLLELASPPIRDTSHMVNELLMQVWAHPGMVVELRSSKEVQEEFFLHKLVKVLSEDQTLPRKDRGRQQGKE